MTPRSVKPTAAEAPTPTISMPRVTISWLRRLFFELLRSFNSVGAFRFSSRGSGAGYRGASISTLFWACALLRTTRRRGVRISPAAIDETARLREARFFGTSSSEEPDIYA